MVTIEHHRPHAKAIDGVVHLYHAGAYKPVSAFEAIAEWLLFKDNPHNKPLADDVWEARKEAAKQRGEA